VLEGLRVNGRTLSEYRVAVGEQRFYLSSNTPVPQPPEE
jgi:hypothetical protein